MKNDEKFEYIEEKFGTIYKITSEWVFAPSVGYGYKIVEVLANEDLRLERHFIINGDEKKVIKSTPIGILRKSRELLELYDKEQAEKKKYIDEIKNLVKERKGK